MMQKRALSYLFFSFVAVLLIASVVSAVWWSPSTWFESKNNVRLSPPAENSIFVNAGYLGQLDDETSPYSFNHGSGNDFTFSLKFSSPSGLTIQRMELVHTGYKTGEYWRTYGNIERVYPLVILDSVGNKVNNFMVEPALTVVSGAQSYRLYIQPGYNTFEGGALTITLSNGDAVTLNVPKTVGQTVSYGTYDQGGGGNPNACTSFTYGAWTPATCTQGSQQTRTVTGSPAGCTGGSPEASSRTCPNCIDTDANATYPTGLNYGVFGSASGAFNGIGQSDYCGNPAHGHANILFESYCRPIDGSPSTEYYTCQYGCSEGRCLDAPVVASCTDLNVTTKALINSKFVYNSATGKWADRDGDLLHLNSNDWVNKSEYVLLVADNGRQGVYEVTQISNSSSSFPSDDEITLTDILTRSSSTDKGGPEGSGNITLLGASYQYNYRGALQISERARQVRFNSMKDYSSCSIYTAPPTCTDSDGGLNYYVKGNLTTSVSPGTNFEDYCLSSVSSSQLIERHCLGSDPNNFTVQYSCTNGCNDGACVYGANQDISLTNVNNVAQFNLGNDLMKVKLAAATDVSATIEIIDGQESVGTTITEGSSKLIGGVTVELISADESSALNSISAVVKISAGSVVNRGREKIEIRNSGNDKMTIKFKEYTGAEKTVNWLYNRVPGQMKLADSDGDNIVVAENELVNKSGYVVLANKERGGLYEITGLTNSSSTTASDDELTIRNVFTDASTTAKATSEGSGNITVEGLTFSYTYTGAQTLSDVARQVKFNYPESLGNSKILFPTIKTSLGAKVAFYQPASVDLSSVNSLMIPSLEYGAGYMKVEVSSVSSGVYHFDIGSLDAFGNGLPNVNTLLTDSFATFWTGSSSYEIRGSGVKDKVIVSLLTFNVAPRTSISTPAVVLFEELSSGLYGSIIVVPDSGYDGDSQGVGVERVMASLPVKVNVQDDNNDDLYITTTSYGTKVTVNKADSDQATALVDYPDVRGTVKEQVCEEYIADVKNPSDFIESGLAFELTGNGSYTGSEWVKNRNVYTEYSYDASYAEWMNSNDGKSYYFSKSVRVFDDVSFDVKKIFDEIVESGLCVEREFNGESAYVCAYNGLTGSNNDYNSILWFNDNVMVVVDVAIWDKAVSNADIDAINNKNLNSLVRDIQDNKYKDINENFELDNVFDSIIGDDLQVCSSDVSNKGGSSFGAYCKIEPVVCPEYGKQIEKCYRYVNGREVVNEKELQCSPGICSGCMVPRWMGYDFSGSKTDSVCIPYGTRLANSQDSGSETVNEGYYTEGDKEYTNLTIYDTNSGYLDLDIDGAVFKGEIYENANVDAGNIRFNVEEIFTSEENSNDGGYIEVSVIESFDAYCKYDGDLYEQKGDDAQCQNNYECSSNECRTGQCVNTYVGVSQNTNILVKIICRIVNIPPFGDAESYEQCLLEYAGGSDGGSSSGSSGASSGGSSGGGSGGSSA